MKLDHQAQVDVAFFDGQIVPAVLALVYLVHLLQQLQFFEKFFSDDDVFFGFFDSGRKISSQGFFLLSFRRQDGRLRHAP